MFTLFLTHAYKSKCNSLQTDRHLEYENTPIHIQGDDISMTLEVSVLVTHLTRVVVPATDKQPAVSGLSL